VPDITVSMPSDASQGTEARRFRLIFDQQRRAVLAYVLRRVDDPEDAADAVAETFLVAWRRLDDVPRGDGARPWLLGVARRVLANQRRGARRHTGLANRLGHELAVQIPAVADASETDLVVRRALASLSDDDREILLLAGWEGLSPAEIAVAAGLSDVAARSRLHRARRRFRAELAALGWQGPPGSQNGRASTLDLAKEHTR
jgi:RNA polymerase sigma factor (sigma-70 family)